MGAVPFSIVHAHIWAWLDFILLQAPAVTFPDDFPNSVRHFLLIGFLASFICAIIFFYMGYSRKNNTVMHAVLFFVCAITAWYIPAFPIPLLFRCPRIFHLGGIVGCAS